MKYLITIRGTKNSSQSLPFSRLFCLSNYFFRFFCLSNYFFCFFHNFIFSNLLVYFALLFPYFYLSWIPKKSFFLTTTVFSFFNFLFLQCFLYGFGIIIVDQNFFDSIFFGQYSSIPFNLIAHSNPTNLRIHNRSHGIQFSPNDFLMKFPHVSNFGAIFGVYK